MPSWWGKSSSKDVKKKTNRENFFVTLHRLITSSERKGIIRSRGSRHCSDTVSEIGTHSKAVSRSSSPSKLASRCQSFSGIPHSQPLPLPQLQNSSTSHPSSGISTPKPVTERHGKPPLPASDRSRRKPNVADADGELGHLATSYISCYCSVDGDDPADSQLNSPTKNESKNTRKHFAYNQSSLLDKDHIMSPTLAKSREALKPNISISSSLRQTAPGGNLLFNSLNHRHGAFASTPDSLMSSPSRSPKRLVCPEQILTTWASKPYSDFNLLSSGQCSSPGSGQTSGHNSMGGDMSAQLFLQHSRGSPECSPMLSPKKMSPGPSSRINSGAVTPLHPRSGGALPEPFAILNSEGKKQRHRLPLPPIRITNSPFSPSNSASGSPSLLSRSPGRNNNPLSPGSQWKKGKLIGRGTFGHVYAGFNSETGEMCAVKEVTLFSDDAKSKESARQLGQEVSLLSGLRHPNIVQYYGYETVDDKLYIYLEYVSGGSIHKLLQEYGRFGELAIRNYTYQILSGLAYLHAKNTIHRDIKGANILVDPNGCIKLADFGMAKHITGQSCPLSFRGTPYWMAPEVIKNTNGYNLAVDIWSLGCTVLEMATSKPPWSQYEGIAAMFKIGNSKDLPAIPDHLSEEGKDFVRQCLQRDPLCRPTAAVLLHHPFVKNFAPSGRPIIGSTLVESIEQLDCLNFKGNGNTQEKPSMNIGGSIIRRRKGAKSDHLTSDIHHRNLSCPVSPISRPIQQVSSIMSPPILSPKTISGSSTPLTGGSGGIPSKQLKQCQYTSARRSEMPKASRDLYVNGHTCLESKLDLFRTLPEPTFQDPPVFGDDLLYPSIRRPFRGGLHETT